MPPCGSLAAAQLKVAELPMAYGLDAAGEPGAGGGVTSQSFKYCASNGSVAQPPVVVGTDLSRTNKPLLSRLVPETLPGIRNWLRRVLSIWVSAAMFLTL